MTILDQHCNRLKTISFDSKNLEFLYDGYFYPLVFIAVMWAVGEYQIRRTIKFVSLFSSDIRCVQDTKIHIARCSPLNHRHRMSCHSSVCMISNSTRPLLFIIKSHHQMNGECEKFSHWKDYPRMRYGIWEAAEWSKAKNERKCIQTESRFNANIKNDSFSVRRACHSCT